MAIKILDIYPRSPIYIRWRKHFCPNCNNKLEARYDSRVIDKNSPEGKKMNYLCVFAYPMADIEERTWYLYCPKCESKVSVEEIKKSKKNSKL